MVGARLSYTGMATYDAMDAYLSYSRLLRARHVRAHPTSLLTLWARAPLAEAGLKEEGRRAAFLCAGPSLDSGPEPWTSAGGGTWRLQKTRGESGGGVRHGGGGG